MTLPVSFKLSPTNVPHTNVHRTHASVPMLSYPYPRSHALLPIPPLPMPPYPYPQPMSSYPCPRTHALLCGICLKEWICHLREISSNYHEVPHCKTQTKNRSAIAYIKFTVGNAYVRRLVRFRH